MNFSLKTCRNKTSVCWGGCVCFGLGWRGMVQLVIWYIVSGLYLFANWPFSYWKLWWGWESLNHCSPELAIDKEAHQYVFNNGTRSVGISSLNAWSMKRAHIVPIWKEWKVQWSWSPCWYNPSTAPLCRPYFPFSYLIWVFILCIVTISYYL